VKLTHCYEEYLDVNLNIQSESTKKHYEIMLRNLGKLLGKEPELADLSDLLQSRYARSMLNEGKSAYTINQRLEYMRALWRHACRRGYLQVWPTSTSVPEPRGVPCAWTQQELTQLWSACDQQQGEFRCGNAKGVSRSAFWLCFHLIAYWTGERTNAILQAEWSWLNGSYLSVPARYRKGRRQAREYWLPEGTLRELEALREPSRKRLFPMSQAAFYKALHRFQERAGLDGHRIGPQKMRRTHASLVARYGGDPVKALGHSKSQVTEEFYLDPKIVAEQPYNRILPEPGQPSD